MLSQLSVVCCPNVSGFGRLTLTTKPSPQQLGFYVTVSGLTGSTYTYDANGNARHDGRTGRDLSYNYLNLPRTVNSGSNTISYTYTAMGEKLQRVSSTGGIGTTNYDNGIVRDNGLVFSQTEEGRVLTKQPQLRIHAEGPSGK